MKGSPVKRNMFIFVFKECVPVCARKKKKNTQELWRPCLRSGYKLMMRSKTRRQVRETTENMLFQGDFGVSAPRMQDLKSLQSGEHSQHLQAHTGVPGARLEVVHWHMEPFGFLFFMSCISYAPWVRFRDFLSVLISLYRLSMTQHISTHVRGQG